MTQKTLSERSRYTSIIISVAVILLTLMPWLKIPAVNAVIDITANSEIISEWFRKDIIKGSFNLWESISIVGQISDSRDMILGVNATLVVILFGWGAISFGVVNLIYIIVTLCSKKAKTSFCTFNMVCCIFYCLCYALTVLGINKALSESTSYILKDIFSMTAIPFVEIFLLVVMRYFQIPQENTVIVEKDGHIVEETVQVEEKKQVRFCPACGTDNKPEAKFCRNCGNNIEKKQDTCPVCNSVMDEDAVFCINCGTKTEKSTGMDF